MKCDILTLNIRPIYNAGWTVSNWILKLLFSQPSVTSWAVFLALGTRNALAKKKIVELLSCLAVASEQGRAGAVQALIHVTVRHSQFSVLTCFNNNKPFVYVKSGFGSLQWRQHIVDARVASVRNVSATSRSSSTRQCSRLPRNKSRSQTRPPQ